MLASWVTVITAVWFSLATFWGMTHETFYRTAKELEQANLVNFSGPGVEILAQERLVEIME